MRGLELRMQFARFKVEAVIQGGPCDALDEAAELLWHEAYVLGYAEQDSGMDTPPFLFRDSFLQQAWQQGCDDAEMAEEYRACAECNDGTGNPCSSHG